MKAATFDQQMKTARQHLGALWRRADKSSTPWKEFLVESLPNLSTTLDRLQIAAKGERRRQNGKLAAAYHALEAEHRRYQELREFVRDGYLVTDGVGVIREANNAAAILLNVSRNSLLGQSLLNFVAEAEKEAFLTWLLQTDGVEGWEARLQPPGCPSCTVFLTVAAVHDAEGKRIGLRWLLRNNADFKRCRSEDQKRVGITNTSKIMDNLVHEVLNDLQSINMELDFLSLPQSDPPADETIFQRIEQASRLLREGREYFTSSKLQFCVEHPAAVLEESVQSMETALRRQGIRLRVTCSDPLPLLQFDRQQFHRALERVLAFSCALLPHGGELGIEAKEQELHGQRYVELKVRSFSANPVKAMPNEAFRPFLRVNSYQAGLSLVLARRILSRHHGKISFHKANAQQGCFTLLLKAHTTQ